MPLFKKPPMEPDPSVDTAETEYLTRELLETDVPIIQFISHDADLVKVFNDDADLRPFLPVCTRLLRLTRVSNKEKLSFQDDIELTVTKLKMFMREDECASQRVAKIDNAALVLKYLINDSEKGFKLTLATQVRKYLEINRRENAKNNGGNSFD